MKKAVFILTLACNSILPDPRDYAAADNAAIRDFYAKNHQYQTVDFVRGQHAQYIPSRRKRMTIWQAVELVNTLIDESDPDLDIPQIYHCYQTAEAIRKDGHPEWMIVTGFIHDLGKVLTYFGEPQWAVVGDTFPVGCAFLPEIICADYFDKNLDTHDSRYNSYYGIYEPHCGLDNVYMSWGHDEYLYHVVKDYLPEEALYCIRYHSFYPQHQHGAYDHLLNEKDQAMFHWVKIFNHYDLYSKDTIALPDIDKLEPYYKALLDRYFPHHLWW